MSEEVWRPVVGHEGLYSVSSMGRIRSERTGRILRPGNGPRNKYRGLHLCLPGGGRRAAYLHTIVLEAFSGPRPAGHEARHLDGDTENNSATNLAWGSREENAADRARHGTVLVGAKNPMARLDETRVAKAKRLRAGGLSFSRIAVEVGVTTMTAWRAVTGHSWKSIKE